MKPPFPLLLSAVLAFGTGCVVFPHREVVAPPASGQVLDAYDRSPVAQARVTRSVEAFDQNHGTVTDAGGVFMFRQDTVLRWLPFVGYAPTPIEYRIEAQGYHLFRTNVYGGGSYIPGREPHQFGAILIQRNEQ